MILLHKLKRKPKVGEEDEESSLTISTSVTKTITDGEITTITITIMDGTTITITTTVGVTITITMAGETKTTIMDGEITEEIIKAATKVDRSGVISMEWSGLMKCKNIKEMLVLSKSTTLKNLSKIKSSSLNHLHTNKNLKNLRKMDRHSRMTDSLLTNNL